MVEYDEATGHWRHLLINPALAENRRGHSAIISTFQNLESRLDDPRSIGREVDDWNMLGLSHDTVFSSRQLHVNGTGSDRCG